MWIGAGSRGSPPFSPADSGVQRSGRARAGPATVEPWSAGVSISEPYPAAWEIRPAAHPPARCVSNLTGTDEGRDLSPALLHSEMISCGVHTLGASNHTEEGGGEIHSMFSTEK